MATITPKRLGQAQLGTAAGDVYAVPASTTGVIRSITICNIDTVAHTFRLFLVPSGGASDGTTAIFFDQVIQPSQTIQDSGVHVLAAAGKVRGLADTADKVTVTVDGAEVA